MRRNTYATNFSTCLVILLLLRVILIPCNLLWILCKGNYPLMSSNHLSTSNKFLLLLPMSHHYYLLSHYSSKVWLMFKLLKLNKHLCSQPPPRWLHMLPCKLCLRRSSSKNRHHSRADKTLLWLKHSSSSVRLTLLWLVLLLTPSALLLQYYYNRVMLLFSFVRWGLLWVLLCGIRWSSSCNSNFRLLTALSRHVMSSQDSLKARGLSPSTLAPSVALSWGFRMLRMLNAVIDLSAACLPRWRHTSKQTQDQAKPLTMRY